MPTCSTFIGAHRLIPARIFVIKLSGIFGLAFLLVACATGELHRPGNAVADSLYFGTGTPSGHVTKRDWQRFLATVITPRFPKGVTSWIAAGQWQNRDGSLAREQSHVVLLIHDDSTEAERAISEIISIYKERFRQEAVLRVRSPAQVSF